MERGAPLRALTRARDVIDFEPVDVAAEKGGMVEEREITDEELALFKRRR